MGVEIRIKPRGFRSRHARDAENPVYPDSRYQAAVRRIYASVPLRGTGGLEVAEVHGAE